jgi:apolipoprotein N-acyltransferase
VPAAASAIAGGVLYFLGYLGYGVWPCLLVFLVPLWRALDRTVTLPGAAAAGLVFASAAYAGGFLWMWPLVDAFLGGNRVAGAAMWLAYGAWFASGYVLYAMCVRALRRGGWPMVVAGVAPLVAIEWLKPEVFPVYAGAGLLAGPVLVQVADLGGPLLLTALVALANVAAYETWTWWRGIRERPLGTWVGAAAVGAAVLAYGHVRESALEAAASGAPVLRVGVVQANLGVLEKRAQSVVSHRKHLEQTRELLADGAVDLVIWPETAYVRGLRRPLPIAGQPIAEDLGVPLLFGSSTVWEENGRRWKSNSALLVGADG